MQGLSLHKRPQGVSAQGLRRTVLHDPHVQLALLGAAMPGVLA